MADEPASPVKDPSADRESRATVWSAVFAGFSLLGLIASIVVGIVSANMTQAQNNDTRQQELVTLVTDIEQGQQGSGTINGQSVSAELTQLGEAEEAQTVIDSLPRSDVSSVEWYIVGLGLQDGEDYQAARPLLIEAAQKATDPRTAADAWRAAANLSYKMGLTTIAIAEIRSARSAFGRDTLPFNQQSNEAFTDLFDIPYQVHVSCTTAEQEWTDAAALFRADNGILAGPSAMENEAHAARSLTQACDVPSARLRGIDISGSAPQSGNAS